MNNPNGADSLRTDERSWLIYDDESIGAMVRGLESYSMSIVGQRILQSRHANTEATRGIGNMSVRLGEMRGDEMIKNGGAQEVAAEWFVNLGKHLGGRPHDEVLCSRVLDELWATGFRLDSRLKNAGTVGPGTHRMAGRGD